MPKTATGINGRVTLAKLFLKLQMEMEDKSRVGAGEIGSRTISNGPNKSQFKPIQSNHWVDRGRPGEKQVPKIFRPRLQAPLGFNNITYAFMEWKSKFKVEGNKWRQQHSPVPCNTVGTMTKRSFNHLIVILLGLKLLQIYTKKCIWCPNYTVCMCVKIAIVEEKRTHMNKNRWLRP